jgi:hypothetical protein
MPPRGARGRGLFLARFPLPRPARPRAHARCHSPGELRGAGSCSQTPPSRNGKRRDSNNRKEEGARGRSNVVAEKFLARKFAFAFHLSLSFPFLLCGHSFLISDMAAPISLRKLIKVISNTQKKSSKARSVRLCQPRPPLGQYDTSEAKKDSALFLTPSLHEATLYSA